MPKKTFTLYLAKEDVQEFDGILTETAQQRLERPNTQAAEIEDFAQAAILYVFVGDRVPPRWLTDLRQHFAIDGRIENNSSSAILAFRQDNRIFAVTFAHAWMFLNDQNFEGDFGLRVALNSLDDSRLRRLERSNLGDALRGVSHSPFQRNFASFGLDDALDLVRKISGNTKDGVRGDALTGGQSLRISGEFAIPNIPELASEALDQFVSLDYQNTSFRIIDVVTPVSDPRLITRLDELAVDQIKAQSDSFELGLPVFYEDDEVAYKFVGPRLRGRHPDLLLRNYTEALGDKLDGLNIDTLYDHKVVAVYDDDAKPDRKWSIRTALVGSLVMDNGRYAVNEGNWYRIDDLFRQSIEDNFLATVQAWDIEPRPLRKIYDQPGTTCNYQSEASYNIEIAEELGLVPLDRTSVNIPGVQRSDFEPCDLIDIQRKRFIHVKKNSRRSNILSHFFKQGANSAQNFKRFPATWDQLHQLLHDREGNEVAVEFDNAQVDQGRLWSVEFWIADTPRINGEFNIPFFSKISLRDEVSNLEAMGFDVVIRFIRLEPD